MSGSPLSGTTFIILSDSSLFVSFLSHCQSTDTQLPEVIEDPKSQSAVIGSSVTLNCTATGRPKPTIRWIKNNDSYAVQSNPRAKVILVSGDKNIHSQLLITGIKKEDDDKYQCVADNSAGEKTSKVAFLHIKDLG